MSLTVVETELRNYEFDPTEFDIFRLYPSLVVFIVVVYIIVVVLGSIGNVLVFCVIVRRPEMWSPTNVLIANLAFADIFVCAFVLPVSLYHQLTDDWVFGRVLCHAIPTAYGVVVYASTLTMTAIAIDRYILIVFPLATKITLSAAMLMVLGIAVSSVSVAAPIAVYSQYKVIDDAELRFNRRICIEMWPSREARKTYAVLTLVVQYFIPLMLIALLYSHIFHSVRHRMPSKSGASRRTKTNLMLVAVVFVFAVAWTPYQLFSVILEFQSGLVSGKYFKLSDLALRALAMSSSCVNPFLYGWLNDNFRNAFIDILGRCLRRSEPTFGSAAGSVRRGRNRCENGESSVNLRSGLVPMQRGQRVQWTSRLFGKNKESIRHELALLGHELNYVARNGTATEENFL